MDLGHHFGTRLSIFCQVAIVLELDHCFLGLGPEDAVDLADIETKGAESGLELGDVFAAHHRTAQEQHPVTEAITGFVEGPPRVGTNYAVDVEPPGPLEFPHRLDGARCERGRSVSAAGKPEGVEPLLDVPDRCSFVTYAI
jgi:hypothetical protein